MGNCKDCRFWGRYRHQECDGMNRCTPKDLKTGGGAEVWADASDDTGLDSGLRTGPLFGCTLFDPR